MPYQPSQPPEQGDETIEEGPVPFSSGGGEKVNLHREPLDPFEKGKLILKMITDEEKKGDTDHNQRRG
jgi:hypothetical protein